MYNYTKCYCTECYITRETILRVFFLPNVDTRHNCPLPLSLCGGVIFVLSVLQTLNTMYNTPSVTDKCIKEIYIECLVPVCIECLACTKCF
jgi:hypothetical protein